MRTQARWSGTSHTLVSTNWFKPSVFQTDKENQKCAGGAHSKRTVSTVPVDPTSFSWWWFSFISAIIAQFDFTCAKNQLAARSWSVIWQPH